MKRALIAAAVILAACDPAPVPTIPPPSVDTTSELNVWLDGHPIVDLDGRTVDTNNGPIRPPEGSTLSNGTLRRTVRSDQSTFEHVLIDEDNVTLDNLTIEGTETHDPHYGLQPVYDPTVEHQHGISVIGANDVTISGVTVAHVWGDGLYVDGGTRNLTATRMDIQQAGRSSVSNVWSYQTSITDTYAYGAGLWLLNLEPSTASQEVVGYRVSGMSTKLGGSRSWWLFADGPDYQCRVEAVIQRPTGLSPSARTRIDPCTEDLVIT